MDRLQEIKDAHAGWVEAGGPFGNSERWIGVLLERLAELEADTRRLEAWRSGALKEIRELETEVARLKSEQIKRDCENDWHGRTMVNRILGK